MRLLFSLYITTNSTKNDYIFLAIFNGRKVLMEKVENNLQEDYPDRWQYCQKNLDKN